MGMPPPRIISQTPRLAYKKGTKTLRNIGNLLGQENLPIYVFGSYATARKNDVEEFTSESDLDLFVEYDSFDILDRILREDHFNREVIKRSRGKITDVIYTKPEFTLIHIDPISRLEDRIKKLIQRYDISVETEGNLKYLALPSKNRVAPRDKQIWKILTRRNF